MARNRQLSPLQVSVLRVLWEQGEATVSDVHARMQTGRPLAQNTVATLLSRLDRAGIITHRTEGRTYVYRALVSEADAKRGMLQQLRDGLFGGSSSALLSHLLTDEEIEPSELAELRALIDARAAEQRATDA